MLFICGISHNIFPALPGIFVVSIITFKMLISLDSFNKTKLICIHHHLNFFCYELFHNGGPYHIETSTLICRANQWTGFHIIETSVMKELNLKCSQDSDKHLKWRAFTAQKMKFFIKDFFSSFQRIWSHLLKKSLIENLIFCAVFEAIVNG